MMEVNDETSKLNVANIEDPLSTASVPSTLVKTHEIWHHTDISEPYPSSYLFHFWLTLKRQVTMVTRDSLFIQTRIGQSIFTAILTGSLFSNIETKDVITMNGLLFYSILSSAMGSFSVSPIDMIVLLLC